MAYIRSLEVVGVALESTRHGACSSTTLARYKQRNKLNRAQTKMVVQYSNRIQYASKGRKKKKEKIPMCLSVSIVKVNRHPPSTPSPVFSSLNSLDDRVLTLRGT